MPNNQTTFWTKILKAFNTRQRQMINDFYISSQSEISKNTMKASKKNFDLVMCVFIFIFFAYTRSKLLKGPRDVCKHFMLNEVRWRKLLGWKIIKSNFLLSCFFFTSL